MNLTNSRSIVVVQMADSPCVRLRKVINALVDARFAPLYVGCRRGRVGPVRDGLDVAHIFPSIPSKSASKIFLMPIWILLTAVYLRYICRASEFVYAADFEAGAAAALSGREFVYDVLDTYADRYRVPAWLERMLRAVEGVVVKKSSALIHVDELRIPTLVRHPKTFIVRNVPSGRALTGPKHKQSDRFVVVASGNLDKNRGIDQLVEAIQRMPRVELILIGRIDGSISRLIENCENIQFLGYVSSEEALRLTAGADAVFAAYDPSRRINRMACPNKLYDAYACGLPVIVNREIMVASGVERAGVGWTFEFGSVESLISTLSLAQNEVEYSKTLERVQEYRRSLPGWASEFQPVLAHIEKG